MTPERNGKKREKKVFVVDGVEEDDLLVGLNTLKGWGVLKLSFLKPHRDAFLTSDKKYYP